jgi:hypothetical protein
MFNYRPSQNAENAEVLRLNSVQLKCGELQVEIEDLINTSLIITRVRTLR